MQGIEITILGAKYVFYGISEELAAEIRQLAEKRAFQTDFGLWGYWLRSVLSKANPAQPSSKDEIIVVCDPYTMAGSAGEGETDAVNAANALAAELGQGASLEAKYWKGSIVGMFTEVDSEGRKTISGMQHHNQNTVKSKQGELVQTVLFIDFSHVKTYTPGLLLPIILHETTHFLEEKTINGNAVENAQRNGVVIPDDIWKPENSGSMGQDAGWAEIFCTERVYQSERPQEKLTTLVEKMAAGSLYEEADRSWVDNLVDLFRMVLEKNGICLEQKQD